MLKKLTAIALSILLALCPVAVCASSGGLGEEYISYAEDMCAGLEYRQIHAANTVGSQIGYAFTYTAGADAAIQHSYADALYGRESADSILDYANSEHTNVLGGINGNAFSLQTGVPLGTMVCDGILLSHDTSGKSAVGVKNNGSLLRGTPNYAISVSGAASLTVTAYNKAPDNISALTLLSPAFSTSTRSSGARTEVILRASGKASLPTSGSVAATVVSVHKSGDTPIPADCFALSVSSYHPYADTLSSLTAGAKLTLTVSSSGGWQSADFVTGVGKQILAPSGAVNVETTVVSARSAIGCTASGALVLFACDGDGKFGEGLTLTQTANEMKALGCTEAYLLDSGANVSAARKEEGKAAVISHAQNSDGALIGGYITFVNNSVSSAPAKLSVTPSHPTAMTGGGVIELSCEAVSAAGAPTGKALTNIKYTLSSPIGTIDGYIFRAGYYVGTATLTATAVCEGKTLTGQTTVSVVNALDSISAASTTVSIPSGSVAKIDIMGRRSSEQVYLSASALKWTVSGTPALPSDGAVLRCKYGYLDKDMYFHADSAYTSGSFTLTASYGYATVSITVNIGRKDEIITDFDDSQLPFSSYLSTNESATHRYVTGKHQTSGMYYNGTAIKYKTPYPIDDGAKALSFWVKGYLPGAYAVFRTSAGESIIVTYEVAKSYASYNGWRLYSLDIPKCDTLVTVVASTFGTIDCIVDEITVSYGTYTPVFTDTANNWAKSDIDLLYDLDITNGYSSENGRVFRPQNTLSRAEFAKMIVQFYNIDTADYKDTVLSFKDAGSIAAWAHPYVKAAVGSGLMNGSSNPDGTVDFLPSSPVSRAQIVTVISRKLSVSGSTLTFSDASQIPAYAKDGVAKAVSAGIVTGYPDNTFRPGANVTRAETARILRNLYEYHY